MSALQPQRKNPRRRGSRAGFARRSSGSERLQNGLLQVRIPSLLLRPPPAPDYADRLHLSAVLHVLAVLPGAVALQRQVHGVDVDRQPDLIPQQHRGLRHDDESPGVACQPALGVEAGAESSSMEGRAITAKEFAVVKMLEVCRDILRHLYGFLGHLYGFLRRLYGFLGHL